MTASFLWLAVSSGALSLLTPCVFPMIPLTVSYFLGHGQPERDEAGRRAWVPAALFALGIISTFTALGLTLALAVGAAGLTTFAADPWVNLLLAGVFLGFAASLFGLVELRLPWRLVNAVDALARRHSAAGRRGVPARATGGGALLMGVAFTLTSFTCTAPFIGTLLVLAAQGSWQRPLVGLVVYSTVFALPFFLLALMPRWLTRLPAAGGWLHSVKVVLGLLELAAALKFLANVDLVWGWGALTRETVVAAWSVIAVAIALYLLGTLRFRDDAAAERPGPVRLVLSATFAGLAIWLLSGLDGRGLGELEALLPPKASRAPATAELGWTVDDLPAALARAQANGRPVFIDFTGYTCTNCRWMEANMFTRPEVERTLRRFELARLFTDGEGERAEQQQALQEQRFGTVALPFYAIMDGEGRTVATFAGLTRAPEEFVAFLARGLAVAQ
ncbi:MAG TPA: cytochrome c biogenesis protein CcdA [Gemmatimonadales bacterium]|nr:cytochrome c biogenesis protein CcdA [Gemmatimonadales bacterium]